MKARTLSEWPLVSRSWAERAATNARIVVAAAVGSSSIPCSLAFCTFFFRSRTRPARRATASLVGALSGKTSVSLRSTARGVSRRARRSNATRVTSDEATKVTHHSASEAVPWGEGSRRTTKNATDTDAAMGIRKARTRRAAATIGRARHRLIRSVGWLLNFPREL